MKFKTIIISALTFAILVCSAAFALDPSDTTSEYEVALKGQVSKVFPLGEYAYIVFVDKGKMHGVKSKKMSLQYNLVTKDAKIGLVAPMAPIEQKNFDFKKFKKPIIAFLNTEKDSTAFIFWTYNEKVSDVQKHNVSQGFTFDYPKPKVGDQVNFVAAPKHVMFGRSEDKKK